MFIFSFKSSRSKIIAAVILIVTLATGCFFLFLRGSLGKSFAISSIGRYSLGAKTNDHRVKFLAQFGWKITPEPIEVCDVVIPSKFNSTYQNYNEIQKEQGLDLSKYREKNCKRYTYEILNYENKPRGVRANLLVYGDNVIGGDISSIELNGFMHGFAMPDKITNEIATPQKREVIAPTRNQQPDLDGPVQTTYRETLEPDAGMPTAPVD